jgi:hypothetical protein
MHHRVCESWRMMARKGVQTISQKMLSRKTRLSGLIKGMVWAKVANGLSFENSRECWSVAS